MRTHLVGILLAVVMAPAAAHADHPNLDLHVGVGAPAGGFGLGVRMGPVEVLAEGELVGAAFVLVMSASAHVNVDVVRRPRWSLYTGAFAAVLQVTGGSDELIEEQYRGGGPVVGVRIHHRSVPMSHSIELGGMYGRCAQRMCNDGPEWVSLQAAYRLHFHLF